MFFICPRVSTKRYYSILSYILQTSCVVLHREISTVTGHASLYTLSQNRAFYIDYIFARLLTRDRWSGKFDNKNIVSSSSSLCLVVCTTKHHGQINFILYCYVFIFLNWNFAFKYSATVLWPMWLFLLTTTLNRYF